MPDGPDMSDMSTNCEKWDKPDEKGARYGISDKIGTGRSGGGGGERDREGEGDVEMGGGG